MGARVGAVMGIALVAWWRRQRAGARATRAALGEAVTAPCARRHPDDPGARWVHGHLVLAPAVPPVFTGNPDQIDLRVELPRSRVTWRGTRSGASEALHIAPGFVIARLGTAMGPIELGLDPNDASILASYYEVP